MTSVNTVEKGHGRSPHKQEQLLKEIQSHHVCSKRRYAYHHQSLTIQI